MWQKEETSSCQHYRHMLCVMMSALGLAVVSLYVYFEKMHFTIAVFGEAGRSNGMFGVVSQGHSYSLQLQLAPSDIRLLIKRTAELLAVRRGNNE